MMKNSQAGYTLIEALAAIAIVGILAAMVTINFRAGEERRLLEQESRLIISLIRETKNRAVTGQVIDGQIPYAYGLYAASDSQLIMYGDLDQSASYSENELVRQYNINPKLKFTSAGANVLFLRYKTWGGVCVDDYAASCGGPAYALIGELYAPAEPERSVRLGAVKDTGEIYEQRLGF